MNKIKKLKSLRGTGGFSDLRWDAEDAGRFNLVFGWNATGKTSFSRLLSFLEFGRVHLQDYSLPSFVLDASDGPIREDGLANANLHLRVFNEDFIRTNLEFDSSRATPIVVVGSERVDSQKELDALREELDREQASVMDTKQVLRKAAKPDKILTDAARAVCQEFDGTPWSNRYNLRSYTARKIRDWLEDKRMSHVTYTGCIIEDEIELTSLREMVRGAKEPVTTPVLDLGPLKDSIGAGNDLLGIAIEVETIGRFEQNAELREWIQSGLHVHSDAKPESCQFCEQPLPEGLLERYSKYFTNEISEAEASTRAVLNTLTEAEQQLQLGFPDSASFYQDLAKKYLQLNEEAAGGIVAITRATRLLAERLSSRLGRFHVSDSIADPVPTPDKAIRNVQAALEEMTKLCGIQEARLRDNDGEAISKKLELHVIANKLRTENYFDLLSTVQDLESAIKAKEDRIGEITSRIDEINGALSDSSAALVDLNCILDVFFGDGRISLHVFQGDDGTDEAGYELRRYGRPTRYLSEGEKSVIALAHFLVKLGEKSCNLPECIVVIDDPVDSQDSNFLFRSVGLLRERLKGVGQLFVLTHNFDFFNLVRDWLVRKNQGCKLLRIELRTNTEDKSLVAVVDNLPKVLLEHKTEYQYLFAWLAREPDDEFDIGPLLPNVARKLLENFAAFKWNCMSPADFGNVLENKLAQNHEIRNTGTAEAVKKFLHEYSHGYDYSRDVTASVMEGVKIREHVLRFIELADPEHYSSLMEGLAQEEG